MGELECQAPLERLLEVPGLRSFVTLDPWGRPVGWRIPWNGFSLTKGTPGTARGDESRPRDWWCVAALPF